MNVLGLDVGSLFSKAVVLGGDSVLASGVQETAGNVSDGLNILVEHVVREAAIDPLSIDCYAVTGQGADFFPDSDLKLDSASCVAEVARRLLPEAGMVVDLGGQSITAILLDPSGGITDIMRNDKCASGSGKFLQVMGEALGVGITQMNEVAACAQQRISISSQCGVFVESEIITHMNDGTPVADIIAGLCDSVAKIVISQALRFDLEASYTLTGGVALLDAVVGRVVTGIPSAFQPLPMNPQLASAYGAALISSADLN